MEMQFFSRFISSHVQIICILLLLYFCYVKNKKSLNGERILLGFVAVMMDYIFIKTTSKLNLL